MVEEIHNYIKCLIFSPLFEKKIKNSKKEKKSIHRVCVQTGQFCYEVSSQKIVLTL